ncbi:MAG: TIR domain-containing protein, partial [Pseudomonadota bacterium]
RKQSDQAIAQWINAELSGRSCVVVLIGAQTAGRKWIDYEIKRGWAEKKGVVGIYIHNLYDRHNRTTVKGNNPFSGFDLGGRPLDQIVKTYDPSGWDSSGVYRNISENLDDWIDEAIRIRSKY